MTGHDRNLLSSTEAKNGTTVEVYSSFVGTRNETAVKILFFFRTMEMKSYKKYYSLSPVLGRKKAINFQNKKVFSRPLRRGLQTARSMPLHTANLRQEQIVSVVSQRGPPVSERQNLR